ncbi:hypothetical protein [Thermococcus paralvinellae]|uniref:S-layer protein C-terminal domain-containing protein n=1 Tax=Thermococcus paralvinellae TaxID=582419 RepID=W0I6L7_9EURY|nr:hypothetical protein [Thermococcus paralvinellae]AHF80033.1 Hypothetical protein TES1_0645 [Thermococcus paralvinellae]
MRKRYVLFLLMIIVLSVIPSASAQVLALVKNPRPPIVIVGNPYPKFFTIHPNNSYTVYLYGIDDVSIAKIGIYYRVNRGEWKWLYATRATINENEAIYNEITSKFLTQDFDFTTFYGKVTLPPQPAGTLVEFKVVVEDEEGHIVESPIGFYFVANPNGKKILIVDPSLKFWAMIKNLKDLEMMVNLSSERYDYNMSDYEKLISLLKPFVNHSSFLDFHNWQYLAEDYNIAIIPPEELSSALEDFKPDVVILSNLWMSEWGISKESMSKLLKYLRENNAGLIVTHGTLYDGMVLDDKPIYLGPTAHIGGFGAYENGSIATALGLELLPFIEEVKLSAIEFGKPYLVETPSILPFIPSTAKLGIKNKEIIKSASLLEFTDRTRAAFGWEYLLPSESLKFAKGKIRSLKLEVKDDIKEFAELQEELFGYSNYFRSISALDFTLVDKIVNSKILDDKIVVPVGFETLSLTATQDVIERVRLLKAINRDIINIAALSTDYMGAIITRDQKHRGDGFRSAYISFEIEAGGKKEFEVLKDLIEWTSQFKPIQTFAPIVQAVVLANDIDWKIKGENLKEHLENLGATVVRVKPEEFEKYKDSKLIIILGGPKAYGGVGDYVKQALSSEEQERIIKGEQGIFIKRNVWTEKQIVIVLAGKDRYQTGEKVTRYMSGVNERYIDLLAEFFVS